MAILRPSILCKVEVYIAQLAEGRKGRRGEEWGREERGGVGRGGDGRGGEGRSGEGRGGEPLKHTKVGSNFTF